MKINSKFYFNKNVLLNFVFIFFCCKNSDRSLKKYADENTFSSTEEVAKLQVTIAYLDEMLKHRLEFEKNSLITSSVLYEIKKKRSNLFENQQVNRKSKLMLWYIDDTCNSCFEFMLYKVVSQKQYLTEKYDIYILLHESSEINPAISLAKKSIDNLVIVRIKDQLCCTSIDKSFVFVVNEKDNPERFFLPDFTHPEYLDFYFKTL